MTGELAPELAAVLDKISVDHDALTASVAGRSVTADSRAELRSRLRHAIYEVFHQGRPPEDDDTPVSLRDSALERDFAEAIPYQETLDEAVVLKLSEESALVELTGIAVRVPRSVLRGTGKRVALGLPPGRPALSPGFFLAYGSRGTGPEPQVLRVYGHLKDPLSAVDVWRVALGHLETRNLHYYAKVLSVPALYPRHDALVVYLPGNAWGSAESLAERLRAHPGLGESTSPFTQQLAPGVAAAWEQPRPAEGRRLSFGEHRAQAVADGLLSLGSSTADQVALACWQAGFDPLTPCGER
ncbi:T3SS effector HopA1 family protein [Allokutzneria sp. A3M-2-11 16]|uniref:T3SS effector HopA1 family protein n=1 Tax=Allokutzneria sp. A3M-2-11 16 TaxID=2962043 RepID=UPI0020B69ED1|nr:T3SS effector HopA1 family protein [Allokutzneria sp. A3M-2-11 16]MCP3802648.1 T3SS effector HopA1 family protein [Allokutzneria sp. A3M-2-11 16]